MGCLGPNFLINFTNPKLKIGTAIFRIKHVLNNFFGCKYINVIIHFLLKKKKEGQEKVLSEENPLFLYIYIIHYIYNTYITHSLI